MSEDLSESNSDPRPWTYIDDTLLCAIAAPRIGRCISFSGTLIECTMEMNAYGYSLAEKLNPVADVQTSSSSSSVSSSERVETASHGVKHETGGRGYVYFTSDLLRSRFENLYDMTLVEQNFIERQPKDLKHFSLPVEWFEDERLLRYANVPKNLVKDYLG